MFIRSFLTSILAVLLISAAGCDKSDTPEDAAAPGAGDPAAAGPAEPPPPSELPGTSDVRAALSRGDYPGAVRLVVGMKQRVTPATRNLYKDVVWEVQQALVEAMGTNQAAAEAYKVLRVVETGR